MIGERNMKKLIAIGILAALMLGVCACGGNTEETQPQQSSYVEGQLNIGYCMVDITPRESVPLQGYGSTLHRFSNDVEYPLKGTVMAITGENGETVILIETDMCTVTDQYLVPLRMRISQQTGIPESQIYVGASHTHAAPDSAQTGVEALVTYLGEMVDNLSGAALEAMNNRKPAQLYYGSAKTDRLNFVRNYTNVLEDGSTVYWGDNHGYEYSADATTQHLSEADPTLHIVKITRQDEKDILLTNYRAHPHLDNSSKTFAVSADYVGAMREAVALTMDAEFMFLQGASGNINTYSKISNEARTDECAEYAKFMMEHIQQALDSATPLDPGSVKIKQVIQDGKINHEMDNMVARAKEVSAAWNTNRNLDEALEIAYKYGIYSPFHANAIASRAKLGPTEEIELNAITIGEDLAIVTAPFELYDTLGIMLEEGSPYAHTLVMGYTGNHLGYMPDKSTFETGSYEVDICKFVAGTGEEIVETLLNSLKDLKEAN